MESEDKDIERFMTNREMIRDMYKRTKNTEDMVSNMKGDVSVLSTVQKEHEKRLDKQDTSIEGLKTWRNVNITGVAAAILAAIGIR